MGRTYLCRTPRAFKQKQMPNDESGSELGGSIRLTFSKVLVAVYQFAKRALSELDASTKLVLASNLAVGGVESRNAKAFVNPGIEHVVYIIKENRTYDQILGDDARGNGDANICLFPKDVTPNQHALADRFALLDNFYVCAEVSADGWVWSTQSIANPYTERNVPYNYSGHGRSYDSEGENSGVPVDLQGVHDVSTEPNGYIWDQCARQHVSYRNYGFFLTGGNAPSKRALVEYASWTSYSSTPPMPTARRGSSTASRLRRTR